MWVNHPTWTQYLVGAWCLRTSIVYYSVWAFLFPAFNEQEKQSSERLSNVLPVAQAGLEPPSPPPCQKKSIFVSGS